MPCGAYALRTGVSAVRRRRDLRGAGKRRSSRASVAVPVRFRCRRATGRVLGRQGSCGAIRCTTGRRCAGGGIGGGSSGCGGRCRCSTWPGSTTSGGSSRTGPCLTGRARRGRGGGSAGRGGRCSTRCRGRWGTLALVAEDLGRDHAAGGAAARVARASRAWSCCSSASIRGRSRQRPPRSRTTRERVVYTGTHDHDTARGWYSVIRMLRRVCGWMRSFASVGVVERQPWWSLIRLALAVAGPGRDDAGPGRARVGVRGSHERPGAGGGAGGGGWRPGR